MRASVETKLAQLRAERIELLAQLHAREGAIHTLESLIAEDDAAQTLSPQDLATLFGQTQTPTDMPGLGT